ncbi:MAG: DUF2188 domain-containing protein [Deltaproteobacteria bacterium]|nr:DUF2188 domain-containing protein [Deltaproteobacteria bacterium]
MNTPYWTLENCPPAITSLPSKVRGLALDYANTELKEGRHPDRAISYGIARAFALDESELGKNATALYVHGEDGQWTLISDKTDKEKGYTFDNYEDALRRGSELARSRSLPLIVLSDEGAVLEKWEVTSDTGGPVFHVQPSLKGWVVRGPDGHKEYGTKKESLEAARKRARKANADLVIHYQDGTIQSRQKHTA